MTANTTHAVIIPTYRRPHLLVQAVDSVLGQTRQPDEVIVVIDGPDPAVRQALQDRRVTVIEQPNGGEGRARNAGVEHARSDWVSFLDDDDLWHPERLSRTVEYLQANPAVAAVQAQNWTFSEQLATGADLHAYDLPTCQRAAMGVLINRDLSYLNITGRSFDLLLERNRGNISTATVRRNLILEAGGFLEGYRCASDWSMFVNVARFTEWHLIEEPLSFVRIHAGNNTTAGAVTNGIDTLRAINTFWFDVSLPVPAHRPLSAYSADYRRVLQGTLWQALRARRVDLLWLAPKFGLPLLPRWWDRLYAFSPPPLTWRLERLLAKWRS